METETTEKREQRRWVRDIVGGRLLSGEAIRRNFRLIVVAVVLSVLYITNRYASEQEMIEIDHLQRVRKEAAYGAMTLRAEYVERCRLSHIEEELAALGEEVKITTSPLYRIKK